MLGGGFRARSPHRGAVRKRSHSSKSCRRPPTNIQTYTRTHTLDSRLHSGVPALPTAFPQTPRALFSVHTARHVRLRDRMCKNWAFSPNMACKRPGRAAWRRRVHRREEECFGHFHPEGQAVAVATQAGQRCPLISVKYWYWIVLGHCRTDGFRMCTVFTLGLYPSYRTPCLHWESKAVESTTRWVLKQLLDMNSWDVSILYTL